MCPGCVAYLAGKVIILMVALALANLTDLKFGLWLLLAVIGQITIDCYSIYGGDPPPIHPSLIFMQMVALGYRGSALLAREHWTKRLAGSVGKRIAVAFRRIGSTSGSTGSKGLMARLSARGWEYGKKPVRILVLWTIGPILSMFTDLRSAVWILLISAFLFGVHFQSFELESIGWGLGYVELWMPLALLGVAIVRGALAFRRQPLHWIRSWITIEEGNVCRCPPDCPGCSCCAPWLVGELPVSRPTG